MSGFPRYFTKPDGWQSFVYLRYESPKVAVSVGKDGSEHSSDGWNIEAAQSLARKGEWQEISCEQATRMICHAGGERSSR